MLYLSGKFPLKLCVVCRRFYGESGWLLSRFGPDRSVRGYSGWLLSRFGPDRSVRGYSGWLLSRFGPDRSVRGYFIDPDMEFRPILSDVSKMAENCRQRGLNVSVEELRALQDDYEKWRERYNELYSLEEQLDSTEIKNEGFLFAKRAQFRSELADMHEISQKCLSLPNNLDSEDYSRRLETRVPKTRQKDLKTVLDELRSANLLEFSSNPQNTVLLGDLVLLQYGIVDYLEEKLSEFGAKSISLPHLVRSVVEEGAGGRQDPGLQLEYSNPDEQNVPLTNLAGLGLSSFMALFARKNVSKCLPIFLYSIGTQYDNGIRKSSTVFRQSPKVAVLSISSEAEESVEQLQSLLRFVDANLAAICGNVACGKRENKVLDLNQSACYEFRNSLREYPVIGTVAQFGNFVSKRLRFYSQDSKELYMNFVEINVNNAILSVLANSDCSVVDNSVKLERNDVLSEYFEVYK